ncbi:MAG: hypothetical protein IPK60_10720 [Sandaracinaceae bacterium]|nr:hypothetical protein [Sandaracinaceae bacterium]
MKTLSRTALATACVLLSIACTSRNGRAFVATDGAVSTDGARDAGPVFSDLCPSAPVFEHMTCTGSTNGAICAGTQYCDSCASSVAIACTCVPYEAGFEFRCEDPCASCLPDAGSADAGVEASRGGCTLVVNGDVVCLVSVSTLPEADVRADCAAQDGTYSTACPTTARIGRCIDSDGDGELWLYSPTSIETAMGYCETLMSPWVPG